MNESKKVMMHTEITGSRNPAGTARPHPSLRWAGLLFALLAAGPLFAQLYHPGEQLEYRVSYKAKMFPNTEVGTVEVTTREKSINDTLRYEVTGTGRTLPTYRWFFNMLDVYTVLVDPATLRPIAFHSDLREGDYTFRSHYVYDWENLRISTRWRSRQRPEKEKQMELTTESMDPISLFFTLRSAKAEDFRVGETARLQMVLQDTIRQIHYRFIGREVKKIRNIGRFRSLRFECELGSSEGFSFTDGTIFTIWISDDENKIPLYIESPVRIGSIQAYISGYKGLKYPLTSKIK